MTKKQATQTMNRVRGMLMHLSALARDLETKESVRETLEELWDVEDLLGLSDVHSDDEDEDDEDEEE